MSSNSEIARATLRTEVCYVQPAECEGTPNVAQRTLDVTVYENSFLFYHRLVGIDPDQKDVSGLRTLRFPLSVEGFCCQTAPYIAHEGQIRFICAA